MAKSKRRIKQAKRRAEKRAARDEVEEPRTLAADKLIARIHREANVRREQNIRLLQQGEEKAWRLEQLRRARGLDDGDEEE